MKKTRSEKQQEKDALHARWRERYWQITTVDLPEIAAKREWEVDTAEAFQRIILDTICKGVWYYKIPEPAITGMRPAQLRKAVYLAEDLLSGQRMLEPLDAQSKQWRAERFG